MRSRAHLIQVYLNDFETEIITFASKHQGLPLSSFIRSQSLKEAREIYTKNKSKEEAVVQQHESSTH